MFRKITKVSRKEKLCNGTHARYNEIIKLLVYLEKHTRKQERFQKELLTQLQKQQQYIQESLEKRDQVLMISIRELQQEKRMLNEHAANQERKPWSFNYNYH